MTAMRALQDSGLLFSPRRTVMRALEDPRLIMLLEARSLPSWLDKLSNLHRSTDCWTGVEQLSEQAESRFRHNTLT
jgi:hypothetical protein